MRYLILLFLFVSCLSPEDGFRVPSGTIGYIPVTCRAHNHIIAFDISGSNDRSDPDRERYTQLLDVLKNKKQESDSEKYLFVEFRDNRIDVNGSSDDSFKSLSEIIVIIERQYQRSRDQGRTPYIQTFESIADIIEFDSNSLTSPMRYSINFFTDGRPCSSTDGCQPDESDAYGPVKTNQILDSVSSVKSLESRAMVSKMKIHTVNYGELTQLSETILDSIVQIGEGNNVSLGDFSNQSYIDTLSQTSFSCQ